MGSLPLAEVFEVFPCSQLHAEDFRKAFPGSMPAGGHGAGKAFHVPSLREDKGTSSMPAGESLRHGARAEYFFKAD
jgi:hypothetical protein